MTTTVDSADLGLSRALRRRGALVLAVFAPLWSLVAISGLAPDTRGPARIVAVLITVTAAVVALRPDHPSARERLRVLRHSSRTPGDSGRGARHRPARPE